MSDLLATTIGIALKSSAVLLVVNEIRGIILAVPVLYGLYQAGGTAMAIWLAVSSLGGIALSVAAPLVAHRKFKQYLRRRNGVAANAVGATAVAYSTPAN